MTSQQSRALHFIASYQAGNRGVSPSFQEIAAYLDLKSRAGVHRLVHGLAERGFITHLPRQARSIEVLKLPQASVA